MVGMDLDLSIVVVFLLSCLMYGRFGDRTVNGLCGVEGIKMVVLVVSGLTCAM